MLMLMWSHWLIGAQISISLSGVAAHGRLCKVGRRCEEVTRNESDEGRPRVRDGKRNRMESGVRRAHSETRQMTPGSTREGRMWGSGRVRRP